MDPNEESLEVPQPEELSEQDASEVAGGGGAYGSGNYDGT
jgi:hypothetical protein